MQAPSIQKDFSNRLELRGDSLPLSVTGALDCLRKVCDADLWDLRASFRTPFLNLTTVHHGHLRFEKFLRR